MEDKLKKLFDYQKFAKNDRLEKMAREADARVGAMISDEDLADVNAAGQIEDVRCKRGERNVLSEKQFDNQ